MQGGRSAGFPPLRIPPENVSFCSTLPEAQEGHIFFSDFDSRSARVSEISKDSPQSTHTKSYVGIYSLPAADQIEHPMILTTLPLMGNSISVRKDISDAACYQDGTVSKGLGKI